MLLVVSIYHMKIQNHLVSGWHSQLIEERFIIIIFRKRKQVKKTRNCERSLHSTHISLISFEWEEQLQF